MELTDEQKNTLLSVKEKVKILPKIEKVEKELFVTARKKEKLEEKLLILVGRLSEDDSAVKTKNLNEKPKRIKESKDRYDPDDVSNILD